jgi:hypothetical protein
MYFFSQRSQVSPNFLTKNATKKNRAPLASNDISINGKKTLQVQSGNKVKKGQIIATTGKNNFYFEMKKFETPINPIKYLCNLTNNG